ncbi:MAG: tetraacyldisaccharide 4'-kinase [Sporocytophaga sp.]|uniref:tetraacyldisaccharide 4'-kinase n=1 Tax=Sporocytophaga sp. TaxID=2231183 RepID=UPI001B2735AC|nr:tetraacyldisaccharide 4'-kinase [Sporocytophaga sp.]MBO9700834.1 tetraacyldisaccharide 4'-kinase [Sporocytophaga sp.]
MFVLKILLWPFAVLYDAVTRVRNYLFDIEKKPSFSFETFVINVGNLTVGGTGKTPHVEFLIRVLADQYKIATLSRGYGRKSKGFLLADKNSDANLLGDEPMQFFHKYGERVTIAVGEERAHAIPCILHEREDTKVILLDDAYQHRYVKPDINILLSDYSRPFYKDWVLPAGRLRESRKGADRADAVIVTKCPDLISPSERDDISNNVRKYAGKEKPVYFTTIKYLKPVPVFKKTEDIPKKIVFFAGIANPSQVIEKISNDYNLKESVRFPDHHTYTIKDVGHLIAKAKEFGSDTGLLTTEKDMVRLLTPEFAEMLKGIPFFYVPIEVKFLEGKQKFEDWILNSVHSKYSSDKI